MKILACVFALLLSVAAADSPASAEEIKLRSVGGVYTVPVRLNGQLTMDFMIDTGAADVGISDAIATRMLGSGVMSQGDFKGSEKYVLADGSTLTCRALTLRSVRVGGRDVADVKASACPGNPPLLLGQSFLKKLGPWALDYGRESLVVMSEVKKEAPPPAYTQKDVEWQEGAGGQGDAAAQFNLALMFEAGDGVPRNPAKVVELIEKSAAQGYAPAEAALAGMYMDGTRVQKSPSKALELYRKAADKGYPRAMAGLAGMYLDGIGVPKDAEKGRGLLEKAAERGDDLAAVNLGLIYQYGQGVPADMGKAIEWYKKGNERGGLSSQFHLGTAYLSEYGPVCKGGAKDSGDCQGAPVGNEALFREGIELVRKAAERGLAGAQFALGGMYYGGDALLQDDVLAYAWYQVAYARMMSAPADFQKLVAKEIGDAKASLEVMEKKMTPAEVAQAKKLAEGWKPGQGIKRR